MAGLGRFKLTDALPDQLVPADVSSLDGAGPPGSLASSKRRGGKGNNKSAETRDKTLKSAKLSAEQLAEARESKQAKNAEAAGRDRMVDIGRGKQLAGRQRAK
jgi:hypothetical protein